MENSLDFAALRQFIVSHVENFEQLEALLLLRRHRQSLSAAVVASELKIDTHQTSQALRALVTSNLVAVDDSSPVKTFRYSPASADLSQGVDLLAAAYDEHRVKVVQLMSRNALDRARTIALRNFADGFRLGGPKKNG